MCLLCCVADWVDNPCLHRTNVQSSIGTRMSFRVRKNGSFSAHRSKEFLCCSLSLFAHRCFIWSVCIVIIGIKHGVSCSNIRQVPLEVLKTEVEGRGFQHLPRDLANVNALKNHVRSQLLHKNWKYLLHFALFLALFCFAFSPMSRERYFHGLCSFWGRAVHISWWQQFCGPGTSILKVP